MIAPEPIQNIAGSQAIDMIRRRATHAILRARASPSKEMLIMGRLNRNSAWLLTQLIAFAGALDAQTVPGYGRFSLYATGFRSSAPGQDTRDYGEIVASLALVSPVLEGNSTEYGMNLRVATYPSLDRENRLSVYDAYVGRRMFGGAFGIRVGQLWLNDLGALGSLGGVMAEYRQPGGDRKNRLRVGGFYGLEPKILEPGYIANVRKMGGYFAVDGRNSRRHVLGLVSIRNSGWTERAVLSFSNFLPAGRKFFMYQSMEYDLVGPAGEGPGRLSYFFANARYAPTRVLEVQGTYHRGRSIDARTITTDHIHGRPISSQALEGLLFESGGGRAWLAVAKGIRIFGGYARDRNNREDSATGRTSFGVQASDLLNSGLDLNISDSRMRRTGFSSDSWYVSAGRNITARVYLSGDYAASLAVFRVTRSGDFQVENRPSTRRYSLSGIFHLNRALSLTLSAEHLRDQATRELRIMSGLTCRFK